MSRGFKIFLFLLIGVATFAVYRNRESRLIRILDGFYAQVVEVEKEEKEQAWEDYGPVNPIDGALSIDDDQNEVLIVKVKPDPLLVHNEEIVEPELPPEGEGHYLPEGDIDGSDSQPIGNEVFIDGELAQVDEDPTLDGDHQESQEDLTGTEDENSANQETEDPVVQADQDGYTELEHLVTSNEKLWNIAEKYFNKGWRYKEIMAWNGLKSESIRSGQKLKIRIPKKTSAASTGRVDRQDFEADEKPIKKLHVHKVTNGESLATIARKYYKGNGDRWEIIHNANRDVLKNPDELVIGMKLKIPNPLGGI